MPREIWLRRAPSGSAAVKGQPPAFGIPAKTGNHASEARRPARWVPACAGTPSFECGSVQPQIGDVLRVGLQLAFLDPEDDVGQDRIGRGRDADLLALAHDEAV